MDSSLENIGLHIIGWISQTTSGDITSPTVVGILSYYLNTLCLTVATAVIGYKTWSYMRFVAAKGAVSSEKMAMGVTTLRSAIAIGCLAPVLYGGQSIAQHSLTKLAQFTVTFTDSMTVALAQHMESTSGVVTIPQFGMDGVIANVIRAEVCHEYIDSADRFRTLASGANADHDITPFFVSIDGASITYKWGFEPRPEDTSWYRNDYDSEDHCGSLSLKLANNIKGSMIFADTIKVSPDGKQLTIMEEDPVYKPAIEEQHLALMNLIHAVRKSAPHLVEDLRLLNDLTASQALGLASSDELDAMRAEIGEMEDKIQATVESIASDPQFGSAYKTAIGETAIQAAQRVHSAVEEGSLEGYTWKDELEEKGFLALGTYYMVISKTTQAILAAQEHRTSIKSKVSWEINAEVPGMAESFKTQLDSISKRLEELFKVYLANNKEGIGFEFVATEGLGGQDNGSGFMSFWDQWMKSGVRWLQSALTQGTGDIIVRLQTFGTQISMWAEPILLIIFGISLLGSVMAKIPGLGTLAGAAISGANSGGLAVVMKWLVFALIVGTVLQMVLPFIPVLYWLTAIMSWAMSYTLALFFVPIWMLTHVFASGEDWMTEHNRSGYMMILEIVARPPLMVIGFMMAYSLMRVSAIGLDIATGYLFGLGSGYLGLGSVIAILILSAFVSYKLLTRAYSLVSELSDMLLNRAGAGQASFGEKSDADQQSSIIAGVVRTSGTEVAKFKLKDPTGGSGKKPPSKV